MPISIGLKRSDPFRHDQCRFGSDKCIIEKGKDCSTMGVIYEITCKNCQENITIENGPQDSRKPGGQLGPNYIGMTMTSAHCRMTDHLKGQRQKRESNPLYRHDRDDHGGMEQEYSMRILTREQSVFPLTITEALYIEAQCPGTSINDRNEYGRGGLVRITASRGLT